MLTESQKFRVIGLVIIVVFSLAIVLSATRPHEQLPDQPADIQTGTALLKVDGMGADIRIEVSGTPLMRIMQDVNAKRTDMLLTTQSYEGLGTLITGMFGKENGTDSKYWQYKVNGVMPLVGADQYIPKRGDTIEWYFGPSLE